MLLVFFFCFFFLGSIFTEKGHRYISSAKTFTIYNPYQTLLLIKTTSDTYFYLLHPTLNLTCLAKTQLLSTSKYCSLRKINSILD